MPSSHHRDPNTIPSATPADYTRVHNYADWEADHPGEPPPGSYLNADFDAAEQAIAETQDRLALIQREDGNLADEIVTLDALHPDTAGTLLEQIGVDAAAVQQAAIDATAAAASADTDAGTASAAAVSATASAAAASSSADDAQTALESLESQITFLDQLAPPENIPVSGGETYIDFIDADADIDAIELFKNGLMLFVTQDYTKSSIPGGIRFTLVVSALVTDKYWVRTPQAYVPSETDVRVGSLENRVDALEAIGIEAELAALAGDVSAVEGGVAALTAVVGGHTADIANHESRIDALELGSATPAISVDTTYTVGSGGDYATFTAALDDLKFTRILPGAIVTFQMTSDVTEPGALTWSHPDSGRIVLEMDATSRAINTGGWVAPAVSMIGTTTTRQRAAAAFHVPDGDSFVVRQGTLARNLTIRSPNATPPASHSATVVLVHGKLFQRAAAIGTAGAAFVTILLRADTEAPAYALVGDGARFGSELPSDGYGSPAIFGLAATTLNTSDKPVVLSGCSGNVFVYGDGATGTATVKEWAVVHGGDLLLSTDEIGVYARHRARVEWIPLSATVDMAGYFLWTDTGAVLTVTGSALTARNVGVVGQNIVRADGPSSIEVNGLNFNNNLKACASGVVRAYGTGGRVSLIAGTFSNPPASGTIRAVYLTQGAFATCSGMTYGGTFASNKSNATATWSSSTGQFLSN